MSTKRDKEHRLQQKEHHIRPYKLLAQAVGMMVCLFFILFILGEGVPDLIRNGGDSMLVYFLPMLLFPIAGYFITWFRELPGAMMLVAGGLILMSYFFAKGDIKTGLIYGIPFIISGALFIWHIKKRNELKKQI
jgi:predicted membrane protein